MARRKKQINVEIGRHIRELRESTGMSRETFSEEIGISDRFLASVETGFVGISFETLDRLCKRFSVPSDVILWGAELEPSGYFDSIIAGVDEKYYPILADCLKEAIKLIKLAENS